MNNIQTQINPSDIVNARINRMSAQAYASDILEKLISAVLFDVTFIDGVPQDKKAEVTAELKKRFELWANSWIAPKCREIIAKTLR